MISSRLWCFLLLPLLTFSLQAEDLDALVSQLWKAVRENRNPEAFAICDQVLSRDVVADFVAEGPRAAGSALRVLRDRGGNFEDRMERWREECESDPGSERLNFLLAMGHGYFRGNSIESYGRPGKSLPVRVKLKREGPVFTAHLWSARGQWEEIRATTISLPRKALVGFFGSFGTARFQDTTFLIEGALAPESGWKEARISRASTPGRLTAEGKGLVLTGRGYPLRGRDDLFFAWREVAGNFEFETTVESMDPRDRSFESGLMARATLDPGSPFFSVGLEAGTVEASFRMVSDEGARYLNALCAKRPGDPRFVSACLEEMFNRSMNEDARLAADRLLATKPDINELDRELFQRIYLRSNLESPLGKP